MTRRRKNTCARRLERKIKIGFNQPWCVDIESVDKKNNII